MLGAEIIKQGQLFLESVLFGAFLMVLYDGLRILRRVCRHGVTAVAVEDLLFWLFSGLGMFGFMYRRNDGVIRGFLILGAAAGMILYFWLASRYVVRAGTACLRGILRFLKRVFSVACAPFRRVGHFLRRKMRKSYQCLREKRKTKARNHTHPQKNYEFFSKMRKND